VSLTRKQQKYLKKNIKRLSLAKISAHLDVPEKEILNFLKSRWRKEKYQKFLAKEKKLSRPDKLIKGQWFKQNWKIFVFLAFLVLAVYFNSLGNDFVSDDIAGIKENPRINELSHFWSPPYFNINMRNLIIFLTHKIFGLNPIFYRLANIFFHFGSTWLIFTSVSFFFKSPIPLFTASIFAVHPILTESVAWISGGQYSHAVFWALASFLTYIWSTKNKNNRIYLLSLFLFSLSLFISEKLIVFPLILLLYEVCQSLDRLKTNWQKLAPFWLISGAWGLHLIGLLGFRTTTLETVHYQESGGVHNPLIQIPIAVSSYLQLIFYPKDLTLYHSEMTFSQLEYFFRLGALILFLATTVFFFKKDRRVFFWLSFFLISLLPTLTPLKIAWVVAERYVYLGVIGIFILISLAIQKISQVCQKPKMSYLLLAIILLILSVWTTMRNADWKNQDTLWLAAAKTSPSSAQNHNNLGDYYARHGNLEKAVEEFKKAIEIKPNYGDAYHNLANTYRQMEKDDLAIANYQKALSSNPNLWQSRQNLAAIYHRQGKIDLARQESEKLIQQLEELRQIYPQNLEVKKALEAIKNVTF
jgi:tetratricopeptide (TPR) repeat protein